MNKWIKLIIAIIICQLAGVIGSIFTTSSIQTWYALLNKPLFNQPNWIFAPVWLTLFTLMGISLYLVWNKASKFSLIIFSIQLILNLIWSLLFFGLHFPLYAFIEIVSLWISIVLTIISFFKVSRAAGLILLPYIIWVSFAAILNYFIFILN
jgi:benzodiazapine receptor